MGKVRIKKLKCPRCKKKVWANGNALKRGMMECTERGLCGLAKIDQRLLPTVLPKVPEEPKEPPVLGPDEFEFEMSEPLTIHIVDSKHKYTNEHVDKA